MAFEFLFSSRTQKDEETSIWKVWKKEKFLKIFGNPEATFQYSVRVLFRIKKCVGCKSHGKMEALRESLQKRDRVRVSERKWVRVGACAHEGVRHLKSFRERKRESKCESLREGKSACMRACVWKRESVCVSEGNWEKMIKTKNTFWMLKQHCSWKQGKRTDQWWSIQWISLLL